MERLKGGPYGNAGARVLVTPLQHEAVPPPMCSVVAACPAPAVSVSFLAGTHSSDGCEVQPKSQPPERNYLQSTLTQIKTHKLWEEALGGSHRGHVCNCICQAVAQVYHETCAAA